jgi:hypothetical protein
MPDPDYTDITIVLDRSGSMDSCREETIAGFNRFLDQQQALPGKASITLAEAEPALRTGRCWACSSGRRPGSGAATTHRAWATTGGSRMVFTPGRRWCWTTSHLVHLQLMPKADNGG